VDRGGTCPPECFCRRDSSSSTDPVTNQAPDKTTVSAMSSTIISGLPTWASHAPIHAPATSTVAAVVAPTLALMRVFCGDWAPISPAGMSSVTAVSYA
jgi:hypothetical protein